LLKDSLNNGNPFSNKVFSIHFIQYKKLEFWDKHGQMDFGIQLSAWFFERTKFDKFGYSDDN
jgi:hypothetical protein